HELADLGLEQFRFVAQAQDLPLGERDRAPAVRMRHVDRLEQLRMLVEELRVCSQEPRDIVGSHGPSTSRTPSYTVRAGPFIQTGLSPPSQDTVNVPPRACTATGESSTPRTMPQTTAAQAPVPHASVSPAPRSYTRNRIACRSTTCMKPALTRPGKRAWRSISGPSSATGACATSGTSCTACGLPMESSASSTGLPPTSSVSRNGAASAGGPMLTLTSP